MPEGIHLTYNRCIEKNKMDHVGIGPHHTEGKIRSNQFRSQRIPMGRKSVEQERKIQIVQALHRCLLKKPFNETSIKDIAAEAGVNHGVLHYYFKNKEEVLLFYIDYIIALYKSEYYDWLAARDGANTADRKFLSDIFSFMTDRITLNKNLSKVFIEIWGIASYNKKVRVKLQKAYRELINVVNGIIGNKIEDSETANRMSQALIAYFEGMSLFSVIMQPKDFHTADILSWIKDRAIEMTQ